MPFLMDKLKHSLEIIIICNIYLFELCSLNWKVVNSLLKACSVSKSFMIKIIFSNKVIIISNLISDSLYFVVVINRYVVAILPVTKT